MPRSKRSATTTKPQPSARRASLKAFCRSLPHATEDIKWADHLIFSIGGKMFAGFNIQGEDAFAFKCSDDDFDRLTLIDGIIPAPYSARFGWVAVRDRAAMTDDEWKALLRAAHAIVAEKLPTRVRRELGIKP